MVDEEFSRQMKEYEEKRNRPLRYRAQRVTGYLTDLLNESFPNKSSNYEVVEAEVNEHINPILGESPILVPIRDKPTYEFYVKPKGKDEPKIRVLILHRPDLAERIPGGIKNERQHFHIDWFKDNIEKAIAQIECSS